jgi:hypothetical protein
MSDEVNQYGLSSRRPADVELKIRQECGFGCVVCGCAVCDYERIDPEFKDAREHDPSKMALLCGGCHTQVTRKRWSKQKIKDARLDPICKRKGYSYDAFDIGTGPFTVVLGGCHFVDPETVLRMLGENQLAIHPPEEAGGPLRLSATFYNAQGKLMSRIVNNEWQGQIENWDIEIEGRKTTIRREPRDLALVMVTVPPNILHIERLDMYYKGVRLYADMRGVRIGPPDGLGVAWRGSMVNPECCLEVLDSINPHGASVIIPEITPTINMRGWMFIRCSAAANVGFGNLSLDIGRNAFTCEGDITYHQF